MVRNRGKLIQTPRTGALGQHIQRYGSTGEPVPGMWANIVSDRGEMVSGDDRGIKKGLLIENKYKNTIQRENGRPERASVCRKNLAILWSKGVCGYRGQRRATVLANNLLEANTDRAERD